MLAGGIIPTRVLVCMYPECGWIVFDEINTENTQGRGTQHALYVVRGRDKLRVPLPVHRSPLFYLR